MSSTKVFTREGLRSGRSDPHGGRKKPNSRPNLSIPRANPTIRPQNAPGSLVRDQRMPSRKTAVTCGDSKLEMAWMCTSRKASKIPLFSQYDADDLRRQEVGDGLDVDEQLARVEAADDWDPGHADGDQDQHEGTTNNQELVV